MEPVICGYYRMVPADVGRLAVSEILHMLDGIDWVNDREWERLMFAKTPHMETLTDLWELNYPHFRHDRIVKIIHSSDELEEVFPGAEVVDG